MGFTPESQSSEQEVEEFTIRVAKHFMVGELFVNQIPVCFLDINAVQAF